MLVVDFRKFNVTKEIFPKIQEIIRTCFQEFLEFIIVRESMESENLITII